MQEKQLTDHLLKGDLGHKEFLFNLFLCGVLFFRELIAEARKVYVVVLKPCVLCVWLLTGQLLGVLGI